MKSTRMLGLLFAGPPAISGLAGGLLGYWSDPDAIGWVFIVGLAVVFVFGLSILCGPSSYLREVENWIAWSETRPGEFGRVIKSAGQGELVFPPPLDVGILIQPRFGLHLDGPEGWIVWDWYQDHDGPHALVQDECGCSRAVYSHPQSGVTSTMFTIPCAIHHDPAKSWTAILATARAAG